MDWRKLVAPLLGPSAREDRILVADTYEGPEGSSLAPAAIRLCIPGAGNSMTPEMENLVERLGDAVRMAGFEITFTVPNMFGEDAPAVQAHFYDMIIHLLPDLQPSIVGSAIHDAQQARTNQRHADLRITQLEKQLAAKTRDTEELQSNFQYLEISVNERNLEITSHQKTIHNLETSLAEERAENDKLRCRLQNQLANARENIDNLLDENEELAKRNGRLATYQSKLQALQEEFHVALGPANKKRRFDDTPSTGNKDTYGADHHFDHGHGAHNPVTPTKETPRHTTNNLPGTYPVITPFQIPTSPLTTSGSNVANSGSTVANDLDAIHGSSGIGIDHGQDTGTPATIPENPYILRDHPHLDLGKDEERRQGKTGKGRKGSKKGETADVGACGKAKGKSGMKETFTFTTLDSDGEEIEVTEMLED